MNPWIRFADAPGYTVVMFTTVLDSFGYCRIGKLVAALKPIRRISRLTTTDSTGRLMKRSVHFIVMPSDISIERRLGRNLRSRIRGNRHGGTRLQLELTDRHHAIAGLHAAHDHGAPVDPVAG